MGRHLLTLLLVIPLFAASQQRSVIDEDCEWVTGEREVLPEWVHEKQGSGRYVGISDSCLDSINGENQALLRAWFFAMLDSDISIKIMLDSYDQVDHIAVDDHFAYNYSHALKFSSDGSSKSFRRGRSHITRFGERIVEYLEVEQPSENRDNIFTLQPLANEAVRCEYVASGREVSVVDGQFFSSLTLSALCNGREVVSTYELNGGLESFVVSGAIDGVEIPYRANRGRFWYDDSVQESYINATMYNHSLYDGLWSAMYQALVGAIVNNSTYDYLIKMVSDTYNESKRSITRSLYEGHKSISMEGCAIVDDKFYSTWVMK